MERSCRENPSAPARWSEPGRMADPAPNTGYEPNLSNFSYRDPEHTSVNLPDSHHNLPCHDDATVISITEDPEGVPRSAASSSSKQTAAGRVLPMFGPSSLWKEMARHVSGRTGLQETGAELDRESVAATIFSSQSKVKRDRELNLVHALRDRDNLQKILERKVDLAIQGENEAQQKLYQAETEIEAKNWEKTNSDIAFREINQDFETQRFLSATLSRSMGRSGSER